MSQKSAKKKFMYDPARRFRMRAHTNQINTQSLMQEADEMNCVINSREPVARTLAEAIDACNRRLEQHPKYNFRSVKIVK